MKRNFFLSAAALAILNNFPATAQPVDSTLLSVERIFSAREFSAERFGPARWLDDGAAKLATPMFAKFSPQGDRVAYVRERNLYVQNLENMRITQLTKDGSETIINGTSDWVYEEEFSLRDAFRWSPNGKFIAYWQFDTEGVKDFASGCMRTYLILKEKGRIWNSHPGIREILDEIAEANSADAPAYSEASAAELLGREFDRKALASKGLMYERLDQLTMDILFGVEG